jgi:MoaA/NifB/PqqE/SkfB family radical SAM enzyme
MKYPIAVIQKESTLNIYWTLTDFCNFKCNYCPKNLHSGNYSRGLLPGFPTDEEIEKFLDDLGSKHLKGRKLLVLLSGGEPTLHPMLPRIIERLKEYDSHIGITTNGSKSEEFWKSILPVSGVTLSIQPEFTNIDRVNRISKTILDSGTSLGFNLSCDPKNWDRMLKLYDGLDDDLKELVFPKVLNYIGNEHKDKNRKNYEYEPYQERWMEERIKDCKFTIKQNPTPASRIIFSDSTTFEFSGNAQLAELTLNGWNKMEGWDCNVGWESISIHYNGNVFAGVCKIKKLGRITEFELETNPITCTIPYCVCPADLRVNKRKRGPSDS